MHYNRFCRTLLLRASLSSSLCSVVPRPMMLRPKNPAVKVLLNITAVSYWAITVTKPTGCNIPNINVILNVLPTYIIHMFTLLGLCTDISVEYCVCQNEDILFIVLNCNLKTHNSEVTEVINCGDRDRLCSCW